MQVGVASYTLNHTISSNGNNGNWVLEEADHHYFEHQDVDWACYFDFHAHCEDLKMRLSMGRFVKSLGFEGKDPPRLRCKFDLGIKLSGEWLSRIE